MLTKLACRSISQRGSRKILSSRTATQIPMAMSSNSPQHNSKKWNYGEELSACLLTI